MAKAPWIEAASSEAGTVAGEEKEGRGHEERVPVSSARGSTARWWRFQRAWHDREGIPPPTLQHRRGVA